MNIYVCIKQVPDTETKVQIRDDQSGLCEDHIKWVINPYDEFAIEESIKLKQSLKASKVVALSLGPQKRVQDSLRVALAMGCDEGIIIDSDCGSDPGSENSMDSLNAARVIKAAIKKTGEFKMILTGKAAIDENSQAFAPQLAALLDLPHVQGASKIEVQDVNGKIEVQREAESGSKEVYAITGPCVIGATKGLNVPRYPSLPGIMKAKKKPIHTYSLSDLQDGLDKDGSTDSQATYSHYTPPAQKPEAKILTGEVDQQVKELVDLLKNEAKVL